MRELVKYTCNDCGWKTEVLVQWADLKPRQCMNLKCRASFLKNPNKLKIENPTITNTEESTQEV